MTTHQHRPLPQTSTGKRIEALDEGTLVTFGWQAAAIVWPGKA